MLAASLNLYLRRIWPLDLHGPPPRWMTFRALHDVQVLKKPSSSTRTSVQSALDIHLQQMHWTSGLSRSITS